MKNLLTILFILVLSACTKNDAAPQDQLPPATRIGANTAGCYINGELLVPTNGINPISGSPSFGLEYVVGPHFGATLGNDYFSLWIANRKNKTLYIHLPTLINGIGNYNIGQSNGDIGIDGPNNPDILVFIKNLDNKYKTFYSSNNAGVISITRFDYPNKIYSGTFNCTLYNKDNSSEIIQITNGRFDINGITLNR